MSWKGGGGLDLGTLYACTEISQWNPCVQLIYAHKNEKRIKFYQVKKKALEEVIV
jgi:hypothetical protein